MAILASLGDIDFESGKTEFLSFTSNQNYNFVEHSKLDGKPTLQAIGGDLDTIGITIRLHYANGVDPEITLENLKRIANERKPLPFIFGISYDKNFVITDIKESVKKASIPSDNYALIDWIDLSITLKEWDGEIVEETEEEQTEGEYSGFPYSGPFA